MIVWRRIVPMKGVRMSGMSKGALEEITSLQTYSCHVYLPYVVAPSLKVRASASSAKYHVTYSSINTLARKPTVHQTVGAEDEFQIRLGLLSVQTERTRTQQDIN